MADHTKDTKAKAGQAKGGVEKVYRFKSANKYLSCASLGVQFVNGEATTTNLAVARALAKLDGVTLVED